MDSTENESGNGINGENAKGRDDQTERDDTNLSKSTKNVNHKESLIPKWSHGQRVSNDKLIGLLNMLKDGVEQSIKQTEDQICEYRNTLKSFKP
jgi:hypothetical protein